MSKVNHCQIHLAEPSRYAAAEALHPWPVLQPPHTTVYKDEVDAVAAARAEFTGPHFHGVETVAVSEGTIDVVLPDGTVYMYPLHTVARIKVYTTEE